MTKMWVYEQAVRIDQLPLSQALLPLLENRESGNPIVQQYLTEQLNRLLMQEQSRYWRYMTQQALNLMENWYRTTPQTRWEVLTTNQNLDNEDNMAQMQEMTQAALENDGELLIERMLDNLISNYDLEPTHPELL